MALKHAQELNLTHYSGRVFFLSDPHGHYSLLSELLKSVTVPGEDIVIICTGNIFDYGPESAEMLQAVVNGKFEGCSVRFYSVMGSGEKLMSRILPAPVNGMRKYYPSSYEQENWINKGGSWHKDFNRYHLEELLTSLTDTQLPIIFQVRFRNNITFGVVSSDYIPIKASFGETYSVLQDFNESTANNYVNHFIYGFEHARTPSQIQGVNLVIHGRHPALKIRDFHNLPLINQPVMVANSLFINTGSKELSRSRQDAALTLIEFTHISNPEFIIHQISDLRSSIFSIESIKFDLVSDNNYVRPAECI